MISFYERLLNYFSRKRLYIPHLEELPDQNRTVANTSPELARQLWFKGWGVSYGNRKIWRKYKIELVDNLHARVQGVLLPAAACMYTQANLLQIDSGYGACAGIVAHEFGHEGYSWMTEKAKLAFARALDSELKTDRLLEYVYSQKSYMHNRSDINDPTPNYKEAYADTYRWMGSKMPKNLRQFYEWFF